MSITTTLQIAVLYLFFFFFCTLHRKMEAHATSLVSKARTAFHSAAAKAERVLMDFKSDIGESSSSIFQLPFCLLRSFLMHSGSLVLHWLNEHWPRFLIGEDSDKQSRHQSGKLQGDDSAQKNEMESKVWTLNFEEAFTCSLWIMVYLCFFFQKLFQFNFKYLNCCIFGDGNVVLTYSLLGSLLFLKTGWFKQCILDSC